MGTIGASNVWYNKQKHSDHVLSHCLESREWPQRNSKEATAGPQPNTELIIYKFLLWDLRQQKMLTFFSTKDREPFRERSVGCCQDTLGRFGSHSSGEEFTLIAATYHCLVDCTSDTTKWIQHGTLPADWHKWNTRTDRAAACSWPPLARPRIS